MILCYDLYPLEQSNGIYLLTNLDELGKLIIVTNKKGL